MLTYHETDTTQQKAQVVPVTPLVVNLFDDNHDYFGIVRKDEKGFSLLLVSKTQPSLEMVSPLAHMISSAKNFLKIPDEDNSPVIDDQTGRNFKNIAQLAVHYNGSRKAFAAFDKN